METSFTIPVSDDVTSRVFQMEYFKTSPRIRILESVYSVHTVAPVADIIICEKRAIVYREEI